MILDIILIIISVVISIVGLLHIYKHREQYGTPLNLILLICLFLVIGIIFFSMFSLSTITIFNPELAIVLWKFSIAIGLISFGILTFIHNSSLVTKKESLYLPTFMYVFFACVLMGLLSCSSCVEIMEADGAYIFLPQNIYSLIFTFLYDFIIISSLWYFQLKNKDTIISNELRKNLTLLEIFFSVGIIIFSIYLFTSNILLRNAILIIYLLGAVFVLYSVREKKHLFMLISNKIESLALFHKSGILLFTYNFEKNIEGDESIMKGTILIGISHILGNFAQLKDELNLIKMKARDIILEYDSDYGFALLLVAHKNNTIIRTSVRKFINLFRSQFGEKLDEINKKNTLIDISEFKDTINLLKSCFTPFFVE